MEFNLAQVKPIRFDEGLTLETSALESLYGSQITSSTQLINEYEYFSNSLIINQKKTKKITAVTVVWICDPNYHKILPTLALNFSKIY